MDYYQFNIGDYQRATEGLTPLEHWAYRSLIDLYYLRGGALPNDLTWLCRVVAASHPTHKKALCSVLSRYFVLNGDGKYHNTRCDEELLIYQGKVDAARNAAAMRWQSGGKAPAMPKEVTELKKELRPAVDNSTCQHVNSNGKKCGQPGTHKIHPQSKDWYCSNHREG